MSVPTKTAMGAAGCGVETGLSETILVDGVDSIEMAVEVIVTVTFTG